MRTSNPEKKKNIFLDGYVNKQNTHYWDTQNPDTVTDNPLHLQ
jgi:hypothetical protein